MDVKKLRYGLRAAVCALAVLAAAPGVLAQRPHSTSADSPAWTVAAKDSILNQMSGYIETQAYVPGVDFAKWSDTFAKIKPDAEKAKSEEEFAGIVNAGLRDAFKISHIVLLPPQAVKARVEQKMVGIGIRIDPVEEGVLVIGTVPGAPAAKAGIEQGDIILEADGHKADRQYITGPEGTPVQLKVKKASGEVKIYKVVRAQFNMAQKEELIPIDKDTAAIRIYTFDLSYSPDNVRQLMADASKYKNLLIDLRGNGGGAVGNMMHFLSTLLPDETPIGTFIDRRTYDDFVLKANGDKNDLKGMADFSPRKLRVRSGGIKPYSGRVAVLVNGGSGSASEITAEALHEILHAPVIGKKSAGAVLVSVMGDLPHDFNLQYPISDYVSKDGIRLEANGIVPDAEADDVPFVKKGQVDPAYTVAENYLNHIAKSGQ